MLGRRPVPVNTARVGVLAGEIDERRDAIARRVAASTEAGIGLRLPRLADLFSLSPFERDVLVVCLAVEVNAKYERLYGYLHDDVTRRVPSRRADPPAALPGTSARGWWRVARSSRPVPLHRYALLEDVPGERGRPLLARAVKLDDGIAHHLLGGEAVDPAIAACARLLRPGRSGGCR